MIKSGAQKEETEKAIKDFKADCQDGQKVWQEEIWNSIKAYANNNPDELIKYLLPENLECTIDFAINRMHEDFLLHQITSDLDFPDDILKWLNRVVKGQLLKHKPIKDLSIDVTQL